MAIESIPNIIATANGGGLVYSMDFQMGFSSEPSKITYKVVNSSGNYTLPSLDSSASIIFGGFRFDGYVYSYELDESNSGDILSITLIDKSVILDKKYVCVFRRGLMGYMGTKKTVTVPVQFDSDDVFFSIAQNSSGVYYVKQNNFTNGSVQRSAYGGSNIQGDIIIVGEEEAPDTNCEIPASSYPFTSLKSITGVSGFSSCPISNSSIKKTYEGTLRSVLNSWCQDFGYSFYWDYSANTLRFFNVGSSGVFSIPSNVTDAKITSKKTFASAEGKYNQVAVDYFARPFNPKTASASLSKTYYNTNSLSCYNMTYFINRELSDNGGNIYGGTRSQQKFIASAAAGFVSPALRKIYNYSWITDLGSNVGISGGTYVSAGYVATAMLEAGMGDAANDFAEVSGLAPENIDGQYYAVLCNYDEGTEEAWMNMEQEIFSSKIGNFYRCSYNQSGSSVFCSPTMIVKTSIEYEPEGTIFEDNDNPLDNTLIGRRVFYRGGPGPEYTAAQALEQLGLSDNSSLSGSGSLINKLVPVQIELLSGSELVKKLQDNGIGVGDYDTLMIFPKSSLVSTTISFGCSYSSGQNKRETTIGDITQDVAADQADQCTLQDPNENKCLSAKEELKQAQIKAKNDQTGGVTRKPYSGLVGTGYAVGANISALGGSIKILSSSQSSYQSVSTYTYSVEGILDVSTEQQIVSNTSGSTSSSPNIIETRLIVENRTTAENLQKDTVTPGDLSSRSGHSQTSNLQKVTYTCAGFVSSLSLSPSSGLENLDMSISDAGFSASYTYSTRPPLFPGQDLIRTNTFSNSSSPALQVRG